MSDKTIFLRALEEVYRSSERMIERLLENPSCVDGLSERIEAYIIALEYFKSKQKKTKSDVEGDYNRAHVINFEIMLEDYANTSYKLEKEYAIKIALHILHASENVLKTIPQDLKDEAFQIIFRYLEQQKDS